MSATIQFKKFFSPLFIVSFFLFSFSIQGQAQTLLNSTQSAINIPYTGTYFGGGASFCDFNRDGYDDITLATGDGYPISFFTNDGSGNFVDFGSNININGTDQSPLVLWADYDNDGDYDLFVANDNERDYLYRNKGNFDFEEIGISAGISETPLSTTGACWGDYNKDGLLDLFVINRELNDYIDNQLYLNDGEGSFTEVASAAGVAENKLGFACVWLDFDKDGWQDLYIGNDKYEGNQLFKNKGDGTFLDVSTSSGAGVAMDAMGIAVGDYNKDSWLDLYMSNTPAGNILLSNNGDGTFTDTSIASGTEINKVCWGVNFLDFDNDTDLDLFAVAGIISGQKSNTLLENQNNGTFTLAPTIELDALDYDSFGTAVGDFNNDGYPDLIEINNSPNDLVLWENKLSGNNYINFTLEGSQSNRDGIGAEIRVKTSNADLFRSTHCGISFKSQNSSTVHFGLGPDTAVDSIFVFWPSGVMDTVINQQANQTIHLVEGEGFANKLKVKAFLEGPFNPITSEMIPHLNSTSTINNIQPFQGSPWFYSGSESVISFSNKVIDWVLVEIRDVLDQSIVIARRAGLLYSNGTIKDVRGGDLQFFNLPLNDSYFVSISHRNHLGIVSSNSLILPNTFELDLSNIANIDGGISSANLLSGSIHGLLGGDKNSDGIIDQDDLLEYYSESSKLNDYNVSDCNLDKIVSTSDFNLIKRNLGSVGSIFLY